MQWMKSKNNIVSSLNLSHLSQYVNIFLCFTFGNELVFVWRNQLDHFPTLRKLFQPDDWKIFRKRKLDFLYFPAKKETFNMKNTKNTFINPIKEQKEEHRFHYSFNIFLIILDNPHVADDCYGPSWPNLKGIEEGVDEILKLFL